MSAAGTPEERGADPERCLVLSVLAAAGLVGASGVALGALAAHKIDSPALATAAAMMMIHAAAATGFLALSTALHARYWALLGALMLFAVVLFAVPIALRAAGSSVIPGFVAPIGGSLLIASWLAVAIAAMASLLRGR